MTQLGHLYFEGKLVAKDLDVAHRHYKQAAESGHGPAMVNLASTYAGGFGVQQNLTLAEQWLEKAAVLGEPEAIKIVGDPKQNRRESKPKE